MFSSFRATPAGSPLFLDSPLSTPAPSPAPGPSQAWSVPSSLSSLTPTPSARSRAGSARSSVGPVRNGRRAAPLRPPQGNLDDFNSVNTAAGNFRFAHRSYFLTWSQIGDRPNQLLEDMILGLGERVECA